jgi:predicted nucleotidyltransferase
MSKEIRMEVDWNIEICGIRMLDVRDFLRSIGRGDLSVEYARQRLKIPGRLAITFVEQLRARDLIETSEATAVPGPAPLYKLTAAGRRLASAKRVRRINRPQADRLIFQFLMRIDGVNHNNDLGYFVVEAWIFGSYIDSAKNDLGDLDIAVDIQPRLVPGRDSIDYIHVREALLGRSTMDAALNEVEVLLRDRSPYISLHGNDVPDRLGVKSKLIYRTTNNAYSARPREERDEKISTETHLVIG